MLKPKLGEEKRDFLNRCMISNESSKTFRTAKETFEYYSDVFDRHVNIEESRKRKETNKYIKK